MAEPRLVSNKWEIIRVIGHGGMGSVYEVRHTTLDIRRALKTLHRHLADDPEIVRRFLREGRNEARLEHPNIVRVYDFDTDPEFGAYLTMELVEGPDLKQRMHQGALALHEVLRIGSEIAAALDYAHSANPPVVHRDIKPANILISDRTGSAKVTDFGIAKELADRETGVTGTQGFIGTIRYAAPEQVRADEEIDARVDLYSLGVILYEMLSGKVFLETEKPADIYRRTMVEPDWQPPMVYPFPPPEELAEVIRWCLQRQRADRIPSARELIKCLHVCAQHGEPQHGEPHAVQSGGGSVTVPPALAALPESVAETSLTAATVVPLVVEEDSTTIVGLRARITRLRQDLDQEADSFLQLYTEAGLLGVPLGGLPAPVELAERLATLDEDVDSALDSRDREQLAQLFSRCERLREEFVAGAPELRRRLAGGIATGIADLRNAWGAVAEADGAALSAETRASFEALLERAQTSAGGADWRSGREALQEARVLLEHTQAALTQQAAARVDELLNEAAAVSAEVLRYVAADTRPDVDLAAVQAAAAADLAAGRSAGAVARAHDAVEQARRELERRRREAQDLLGHQRTALDGALEGLDATDAERVAADDFRRATAAIESAREAEQQDQPIAAAGYYREAAESLDRVRGRLADEQAARLDALRTRVTELQKQAAQAPEAVTGLARRRADGLVREHARNGGTAAIEGLETARQLLEGALAEVPTYLAAQAAAEAARAAQQHVRNLDPTPAQLRAITAQQASADTAFSERRWPEAGAAYREAERACLELTQQLQVEREAAVQAETAAAALAAAVEGLDIEGAEAVAADDLAAARQLQADARALQQQREWADATAAFEAGTQAFVALQQRVRRELGPQLTAVTEALRRSLAAATDAPAVVVGTARQRAEDALAAGASLKISVAIATGRAAATALDEALAQAAEYRAASEQRAAAEALQARVAQLGLGRRQLRAVERLATDAAAAFDRHEWNQARAVYAQLREQLASLERQAEQGQRLGAARNVATEARGAVDVAVAGECAADTLREAQEAFEAAARSEQAGDAEQAAQHYEHARALYARTAELVAAEYTRRLNAAGSELRALLERAASVPAEVAGAARQRAEAVLSGPQAAEFASAWAALRDAHANLEHALADVPAFDEARQQRAAAEAALQRVRAHEPARGRIAPVERTLQRGTQAFAERQWARAAAAFREASDQLLTLERTLRNEAQRARTTAARAAVEQVRAGLDLDLAHQYATPALDEAEKAYSRGVTADGADDFDAAVAAFEAAGVAFAAVAEVISREHTRLLDGARARLQQTIESSAAGPQEVVGTARERAQALITDAQTRDPRTALAVLEEARAALEAALTEVPLFTAAREQQQRATEAEARATALRPRPRRKELRAGRALLTDATVAAQGRDWTAMRDRYAQAADAFSELERAVAAQPAAPSVWPRLAAVAGVVVLAVAVVVWQRTQPTPRPRAEPTAAPQAAQEAKVAPRQPAPQPPAPEPAAPQPPAPEPWRLASWEPADAVISGQENKSLSFSITPAGGAEGAHAKIQWLLDDKPVTSDTTTWKYTPDFDGAGDHRIVARIGNGESPNQTRTWTVQVANVNRAPKLADHKTPIEAKVGETVLLKANATDEDHDDKLAYSWTVDGKPTGSDAPQLNLKVAANHTVGLTVSDGKDKAQTSWQIAALSPFVFDYSPKQLDSLRLGNAQEFKLTPTRDLSLADVTVTWTLDGRKVSDGPAFNLQTTDSLVRGTPVKITATALDKQGRSFAHDWKVSVVPPIPKIESATPPTDKPIDAESGQSLSFQVAVAPPVGNQQLTYIYSVDGKDTGRSPKPQFEFRAPDDGEHRVTARIEDNYRQASPQTVTWRLQGSDLLSQARKWVTAFQEARRSGDAEKEGRLRDLSASEISRLKDAYSTQKNLQVSFTAPQIEKLTGNQARAKFTMTQDFEAPNGQQISGRLVCDFTLARSDGRLREERRPQGPCVPVQ